MPQTRIDTLSHEAPRARILGSAVRTITLGLPPLPQAWWPASSTRMRFR